MNINVYSSIEHARKLLTGNDDRIVTNLSPWIVFERASRIQAGAFDFCGSLAVGSQWTEIKKFMRRDLRDEDNADRDWYLNYTKHKDDEGLSLDDPNWFVGDGIHSNRPAIEGAWLARSIQRFVDGKLQRKHFKRAGRNIRLREGAAELFDLVSTRVVISMGIEQIIRACLDHNRMTAAIAATRINFGMNGELIDYHPNIVVSTTKRAALERFMALNCRPVDEHLVIGDSFIDIDMMPDGAFNVWILPHTEEYGGIAAFRNTHFEAMLGKVTIVLYSNSLLPLVELIKEARAGI